MVNPTKAKLLKIYEMLKLAGENWSDDNVSTLSASLAYSTIFSIAPLLIITIGVVGFFFGTHGIQGTVFESIQSLVGEDGAKAIQGMVEAAAKRPNEGFTATLVGIAILLFGASSVFQQLQQSLNLIWKVRPKASNGWGHFFKQRLISFSMILVIAFLLLVSLVLSAALSLVSSVLGDVLPGGTAMWQVINIGVSFVVITLLFAAIFKILPDVELTWKDVSTGAAVTALFFTLGKTLIGLYLGQSSVASAYGAAGSFVIVLLWVYYSAAIMFFGVEFTRVLITTSGKKIIPVDGAELIEIKGLKIKT